MSGPGERPSRVRLFAALELPDEARLPLAAWAAALAGDPALRLVAPESLHVTLVFLGWQAEDDVDAIAAAVTGAARPLGELSVRGAAWLPSPRRPGVLAADLAAPSELAELHADLVAALLPWHEPETRPLRAHVTVARVRRGARLRSRAVPAPPALRFAASALVLHRSHLGAGGSRYEPVARAAL